MSHLIRPERSEHADYYGRYIDLVPDGDILLTLKEQLGDTLSLLADAQESRTELQELEPPRDQQVHSTTAFLLLPFLLLLLLLFLTG